VKKNFVDIIYGKQSLTDADPYPAAATTPRYEGYCSAPGRRTIDGGQRRNIRALIAARARGIARSIQGRARAA
jgi:hypothetical protein